MSWAVGWAWTGPIANRNRKTKTVFQSLSLNAEWRWDTEVFLSRPNSRTVCRVERRLLHRRQNPVMP